MAQTATRRAGPGAEKHGETAIKTKTKSLPRDDLLDLVNGSLDDDKAEDIVAIDMAGKSTISDYMVIASGSSSRHVAAMAEHMIGKLKQTGVKRISVEGMTTGDWVLIDAGDIIVHLFRPEVREFYGLEKMWGVDVGAPTVPVGADAPQAANA
ncbi:MAG: ribosome silencing factor [Proteobacteria bacterium]|nr:ribosome silencing factor [Pseudomonadota bacterium]MDA1308617.1 ribosome silencing factor [Pseudomonadota bacterium]